jgi:hypothetical protein
MAKQANATTATFGSSTAAYYGHSSNSSWGSNSPSGLSFGGYGGSALPITTQTGSPPQNDYMPARDARAAILTSARMSDQRLSRSEPQQAPTNSSLPKYGANLAAFSAPAPSFSPAAAPILPTSTVWASFGQAQQFSPPAAPTLTLETLARSQRFDGSFPAEESHICLVMNGKSTPSFPSIMSALSGDLKTQETVWATILTLACLESRFASDKTSWELLADKAKDYLNGALQDLGVDPLNMSQVAQAMIAEALTAF